MSTRLALLALAVLAAASAPAAAVICESFASEVDCAGRVTSSGECGWRDRTCVVVAPLPPGRVAVTSVGGEAEPSSFAITESAPPGAPCTDIPTPEGHTCAQQKAWGKCPEMAGWGGFCKLTCSQCEAAAASGAAAAPQQGAAAPVAEGPSDATFCTQTAVTGPCRAAIRSWFYDAARRACSPFLWGGCQGNDNRFETNGACEAAAQRFCGGA